MSINHDLVRKLYGHIKVEFHREDTPVKTNGVHNSAFWPGAYAASEFCPGTFEEAGVEALVAAACATGTVKDVLDVLFDYKLRRLTPLDGWTSLRRELPPNKKFVLLRGDSGYTTTPEFVILGRRDDEYRPPIDGKTRWLDPCNTALSDCGWEPTHWAEWDPGKPPTTRTERVRKLHDWLIGAAALDGDISEGSAPLLSLRNFVGAESITLADLNEYDANKHRDSLGDGDDYYTAHARLRRVRNTHGLQAAVR